MKGVNSILKKADQLKVQLREKLQGGDGVATMLRVAKDDLPSKCRLFAHTILEEGCSIGYHQHESETEICYFLKGKGRVKDNGKEYYVETGDVVFTYPGEYHGVTNCGKGNLEYIAVVVLD